MHTYLFFLYIKYIFICRNDLLFKVDVIVVIFQKHLNGEEDLMELVHFVMLVDFVSFIIIKKRACFFLNVTCLFIIDYAKLARKQQENRGMSTKLSPPVLTHTILPTG